MRFNINDKIHGFTVVNASRSDELGADVYKMSHDKTAAQLLWIDNGQVNKLFSIAFKTIPEDSTGVFHILEHSVLNGSEKYPVKEPFVDLIKGSMNTFLNAMTFPDKTMYPVSSRNPRDFLNLASVYLDAVFAPNSMKNPNVFYQEGWHIEQDEEGKFNYKGVVFNEMKGAMSDKDSLISDKLMAMLYPDTCYRHNSGGDPAAIPDLSYEQYKASYAKYYHPSNSRIFLDGSVPVDETLQLLDSYLSRFDLLEGLPEVEAQNPVASEAVEYYALTPGEENVDKDCYAQAKIICDWQDREKIFAADVICAALGSFNEAPLSKAILESGLAQDVDMFVEDGILQPYYSLVVKNVADGKIRELKALIKKTAEEMAEGGLDHDLLDAYINRLEFKMRENEEPAGLRRCINCMGSWLYGGDPMAYLEFGDFFDRLRSKISQGYFEEVLKEMLLEDDGLACLTMKASETYEEELKAAEEARLAKQVADWSDEDIAANKELNEKLLVWQQTPDGPEAAATIPVLPLSEIGDEIDYTDTEVSTVDGVTVLYHKLPTNGIVYLNLYFNLSDFGLEELKQISSLDGLLGDLPTEKYSVMDLEREIKKYAGRISFKIGSHSVKDQVAETTPTFMAGISALREKLPKAAELMLEIIQNTDFNQPAAIRDLMLQEDMHNKEDAVSSGHQLAAMNASAKYSADNALADALDGYTHIKWAEAFAANIDEELPAYMKLLADSMKKLFTKSRLVVSVTADQPVDVSGIIAAMPLGEAVPEAAAYTTAIEDNLFYQIPAQIGFSAQAINLSAIGEKYTGALKLVSQIVSYDYLWNQVRVMGGAYGTGLRVGMKGNIYTYSFRDPTPEKSIEINKTIRDYLLKLADSGEKLDKYIISTVAATEPLIGNRARGTMADAEWFGGYTKEDLLRQRREIAGATADDIRKCADILGRMAEEGNSSIVSHR